MVTAVAGFAVMAAFAGEAVAQAPIATSVKVDAFVLADAGQLEVLVGEVGSPNPKCRAGRRVKITFTYVEGPKQSDTAVTSARGFFAGAGTDLGARRAKVTVGRKSFGPKAPPQDVRSGDEDSPLRLIGKRHAERGGSIAGSAFAPFERAAACPTLGSFAAASPTYGPRRQ